ncbi:MAG: hypothetical protein IJ828_00530 [Treponema sp.]|nr:hypothetical protein [Treponema sp.]
MSGDENVCNGVVLSALPKTWILDLDGSVVRHNGYKVDGHDTLLPGAKEFFGAIGSRDMVIFVTSRTQDCAEQTERFLSDNGIRFEHIIYGAPYGERILVNDDKPSGLCMAYAFAKKRDGVEFPSFTVDSSL